MGGGWGVSGGWPTPPDHSCWADGMKGAEAKLPPRPRMGAGTEPRAPVAAGLGEDPWCIFSRSSSATWRQGPHVRVHLGSRWCHLGVSWVSLDQRERVPKMSQEACAPCPALVPPASLLCPTGAFPGNVSE